MTHEMPCAPHHPAFILCLGRCYHFATAREALRMLPRYRRSDRRAHIHAALT